VSEVGYVELIGLIELLDLKLQEIVISLYCRNGINNRMPAGHSRRNESPLGKDGSRSRRDDSQNECPLRRNESLA
jgi:hypothetical protein